MNEHVTGFKVRFVSKQDIGEHSLKIEPRLQNAKTVVGTRGHHRFVSLADNKLRMHHLSMDQNGTVVQVGVHASSVSMNFSNGTETRDVCRGYKWYVGCIADWSEKIEDVLVSCMHNSTNFPGQLDRASATFPLIMYYAVFHHLFLWVVREVV